MISIFVEIAVGFLWNVFLLGVDEEIAWSDFFEVVAH